MTQDDIICMAREVGASEPESLYGRTDYVVMTKGELERFAALVVAHTRPAIDFLELKAYQEGLDKGRLALIECVATAEREACAKVCDGLVLDHPGRADLTADQCAAAIRARGNK